VLVRIAALPTRAATNEGCGACSTRPCCCGRARASGDTRLELRATRHLFLRQSLLVDRLDAWLDTRRGPPFVASLAELATCGLRDRRTRDLAWAPRAAAGLRAQGVLCWFDAPIGASRPRRNGRQDSTRRDWRDWWEAENVRYIQFLGGQRAVPRREFPRNALRLGRAGRPST
jgi:methionyl-tRNA synthetase